MSSTRSSWSPTSRTTLSTRARRGELPTASAVVADIVDIARRGDAPAAPPFHYTHDLSLRDSGLIEGRYYLRLTTENHPGVLGTICTILGNHGVSIASCLQKEEAEGVPAHVVIVTHETSEANVQKAIAELDAQAIMDEPTHRIRILSWPGETQV